jgi:peptidoglycan/xylan/chitin deacetylase (PgdA/CDA1 family)
MPFRLDRFLSVYGFGALSKVVTPKRQSIPILMYHSISDETEFGHPYFWINTSRNRFAQQMQLLKESNYTVISLTEAVDMLEAPQCRDKTLARYVVLTFDDGYCDFFRHAWPILADHGYTATMFIPTAFIGNSRIRFNGREVLTWGEIRELHGSGISFGSHTMSHPRLYGLPWKEVRRELCGSRKRLEGELGAPVNSFAYPYAFPQEDTGFIAQFKRELIEQGYRTAVTTAIGLAQGGNDPLCLRRLPVNEGDDERLLIAKLSGAYDWLHGVQYISRRIKSRISIDVTAKERVVR